MRKTKVNSKKLTVAFIFLALILGVGCAKKKNDISSVSTDAYVDKSDLTGCPAGQENESCQKLYSAVQTFYNANEELDSSGVIPGTHIDFGTVKFVVTQNELRVERVGEVNRDDEKATLVAAYPISSHFDVVRDKNDFGESTNKIIEDTKRPWNERQFIRVDFSASKVASTDLSSVFGTEIKEEGSKIVTPLTRDGSLLSFETDSTITQTESFDLGVGDAETFSPGAMRAHIKTAFLELKKTDYRPYEMSNKEFSRFGFFRTYENFINPDKGVTVSGAKLLINRFNVCEKSSSTLGLSCAANKIVYTLNKGFPEEYRQAARDVIASWNKSFQKALDRSDDVVILDESVQPQIGDIRYNMIAGVDEAVPTGLLGIMQNVTNPSSGETISAMASVYVGTVRLEAGLASEQFDLLVGNGGNPGVITQGQSPAIKKLGVTSSTLWKDLKSRIQVLKAQNYKGQPQLSRMTSATVQSVAKPLRVSVGQATKNAVKALNIMYDNLDASDPAQAMAKADVLKENDPEKKKALEFRNSLLGAKTHARARLQAISDAEKGIESAESIEPAVELFVRKFVAKHQGEPIPQMRDELKKEVRYMVFYSTLVHEMGHNFGLRHNFAGSSDNNNYTVTFNNLEKQKQALIAQNPNDPQIDILSLEEQSYDFSSVMDYAGGFFEAQGGTGPYDDAAIRFAYNGSIDKNNDPITGVAHNYKFCTDHQVGEDLLCQRWDKGANVTTATTHLIDNYGKNYIWRNNRRDRAQFGNPGSYFNRILIGTMLPVRQVTDEFLYQLITSPQVAAASNQCSIGFLKDSVDAGEVGNLCDPAVAQKYAQAGVDLSDWSQLVAFLLTDDLSNFRKPPSSYRPNGFADLLFANYLASQFFQQVLGTPEPGLYLALQDTSGISIQALPDGGSDDDRLKAFLIGKGLSPAQAAQLIPQLRGQLVDLNPGPNAKFLLSRVLQDGSYKRVETMGHLYDKLAAIVIMGARGLPVEKYQEISLNANMYFAPQTKNLTTGLFNGLITQASTLTTETVTTRGGITVDASVPAAMSLDTKMYGLIFAASDLISDQEPSFAEKLRICLGNDPTCSDSQFHLPQVSFWDTEGVVQYKATQTLTGDSIAYNVVGKGDGISKSRMQAAADILGRDQLVSQINSQVSGAKPSDGAADHESALIQILTAKAPDLAKSLKPIFGQGKTDDGQSTLWQRVIDHSQALDQIDPNVVASEQDELTKQLASANSAIAKALAGQADVLAQVKASADVVEGEMTNINSLTVRIVTAPAIFQQTTQDLTSIQADTKLMRSVMQQLGVQ